MDLPIYGTWPPWPLVSSSEKGRWENHLTSLIGLQREENEAKVVKWYQSLKEISPGCSLEGMMLKLKLQYFGYLMWRVDSLEKTLMLGGIGGGGEGDDRGWDGWMASPIRWTWVWVNSGKWCWTGRPGVLRFMGSQSQTLLSDWTELNWTSKICIFPILNLKLLGKKCYHLCLFSAWV